MEKRKFGRSGLDISVLTFGCGAVGGLMTRGAPADQERALAAAEAAQRELADEQAALRSKVLQHLKKARDA